MKYKEILIFLLLTTIKIVSIELTEETLSKIFQRHCSLLKNIHVVQEPLIIAFSGTIGMGKSFIAKKLEDIYRGVCISTDDLRLLLTKIGKVTVKEYHSALEKYLRYFFEHFKMPNKRFILDASIDRKYTKLFSFCENNNINFIVIRLDVPYDIIVKRLDNREGGKIKWYLKRLDVMFLDYYNFANIYKDYILFANLDEADLSPLLQEINQRIIKISKVSNL